jgi:hypothetical protein
MGRILKRVVGSAPEYPGIRSPEGGDPFKSAADAVEGNDRPGGKANALPPP